VKTAHSFELDSLKVAVSEAKRFIRKAESMLDFSDSDEYKSSRRSATLRASLDLSKTLSEFRSARTRFYRGFSK
jgi:hypothetical protein